jgi:hypothetical protein
MSLGGFPLGTAKEHPIIIVYLFAQKVSPSIACTSDDNFNFTDHREMQRGLGHTAKLVEFASVYSDKHINLFCTFVNQTPSSSLSRYSSLAD